MTARASEWRKLLDKALPALDHVFGAQPEKTDSPDWTLGGGTAIAIQIDHRISYDIDIFVPGTALRNFVPANNPASRGISERFQWPGHYLKFELDEGEIDFLSPPLQTEPGFEWARYGDRRIALETPEEVIIKKIRYRSAKFTPRDVYDLAAVSQERTALATIMSEETSDALPRLKESLRILESRGGTDLSSYVTPTAKGRAILHDAFRVAKATVGEAMGMADRTSRQTSHDPRRFPPPDRGIGD